MFTKVSLAVALLVATVSATSDDFLGLERMLQVQGSVHTAACTSDATCAAGNCCAEYRRINGATVTTVTRTCVNPLLSGRTVFANALNHTWSCLNQAAVAPAVGAACSENSACTGAGECCLSRSFTAWGVNETAGTFCGASASSGSTTFQQYAVGSAPNNFATNVTYYGQCIPDPVVEEPETSSASLMQMTLLAVFAALSTLFF